MTELNSNQRIILAFALLAAADAAEDAAASGEKAFLLEQTITAMAGQASFEKQMELAQIIKDAHNQRRELDDRLDTIFADAIEGREDVGQPE